MDAYASLLPLIIGVIITAMILKRVISNAIRKHRVRKRGWKPINGTPDTVGELNAPPFGIAVHREANNMVEGRASSGVPFRFFDYHYSGMSPTGMMVIRLPHALPELHVTDNRLRDGVTLSISPGPDPSWLVAAEDWDFAETLLAGDTQMAIQAFGAEFGIDISIDGNHVTAAGLPTSNLSTMERAVDLFAEVARSIARRDLSRFAQPDPPRTPRFIDHPDWTWQAYRNDLLAVIRHTEGGSNHTMEDVVTGTNHGLPFVALMHRWETSDGDSTSYHREVIFEFALPFQTPEMVITYDEKRLENFRLRFTRLLPEVDFESQAFNEVFAVRCRDRRFAYDALPPRQLEFLLQTRPKPFEWGHGRARFDYGKESLSTEDIEWTTGFFHDFLSGVPSFVWRNLQLPPPVTGPDVLAGRRPQRQE